MSSIFHKYKNKKKNVTFHNITNKLFSIHSKNPGYILVYLYIHIFECVLQIYTLGNRIKYF